MKKNGTVGAAGTSAVKKDLPQDPITMTPQLRGKVQVVELGEYKPNTWNPNVMTPGMKASLRHGFQQDGWLLSQPLLIWGKDNQGRTRNVIIDGEHRYTVAVELGMKRGPVVVLDGISEPEAKALTIKMNQKRGEWDEDRIAQLVQDIQFDIAGKADLGLELGFETSDVMRMLAFQPDSLPVPDPDVPNAPALPDGLLAGPGKGVRTVQFFFSKEEHLEFSKFVVDLQKRLDLKTPSDVVLFVFRRVAKELLR